MWSFLCLDAFKNHCQMFSLLSLSRDGITHFTDLYEIHTFKKLWGLISFRAIRTIHIFTQMNSVNPYPLSPVLVVMHCGSRRERDVVPSMKKITILIG